MNDIRPADLDLSRVVVIGTSCSGKTTFAGGLSKILGVRHIEMDAINWLPEWEERTTDELRRLTGIEVSKDRWVLDGNYSRVRDIVWPRAKTIVWLNYSFPVVMYRAIKRTSLRALTGEELFNGNRELIRKAFFSTDSMILWSLRTFHKRRRRYGEQVAKSEYTDADFYVIQNSAESEEFLKEIERTTNEV